MIRPATHDDAAAIADIWNDAIRNSTITFNPNEKTPQEVAGLITAATPCLWMLVSYWGLHAIASFALVLAISSVSNTQSCCTRMRVGMGQVSY